MLAGFNEFGFNESSRFNESVLTSKLFLLHKQEEKILNEPAAIYWLNEILLLILSGL